MTWFDAKAISILVVLFALALYPLLRRRIIGVNLITIYIVFSIILNIAAPLLWPWAKNIAQNVFPTFIFDYIQPNDQIKATLILTFGLLITIFTYICAKPRYSPPSHLVLAPWHTDLNYNSILTRAISCALVIFTCYFVYANKQAISQVVSIFIASQLDIMLTSRHEIAENYLFVILIYNWIPFFSVSTFLIYLIHRSRFNMIIASASFISTSIVLFMMFQKRPLILYFIQMGVTWILYTYMKSQRPLFRKKLYINISFVILFSLIGLMSLYYMYTSYRLSSDISTFELITSLLIVALSRIVGRLGITTMMYTHYYPAHGSHYGLSNVGTLSDVFGVNFYNDVSEVYKYFTHQIGDGSVATCAIIDFYGAFGYTGVILGSAVIGLVIYFLDYALLSIRRDGSFIIAFVFSSTFILYLTQASFFRSMMGYGGVWFLALWLTTQLLTTRHIQLSPFRWMYRPRN